MTWINAFLLSSTGSLLITSNCLSANWPSSTAEDTLTPSWCSHCGRRSWRKAGAGAQEQGRNKPTAPAVLSLMRRVHLCQVSTNVWSRLELADTVAMSPVDRMRSTGLKLVSLGKIYAGTPRYFPLGKHSYGSSNRHHSTHSIFQSVVYCFVNSNIISLPSGTVYVSMSQWYRSAGSHWSSDCSLISGSLFKPVLCGG